MGLPEGQMGNSEVGHTNIGAGRIVYQDLVRINRAVERGELVHNPVLVAAMDTARKDDKALHLMGLIGPGGVHASQEHLIGLLKAAQARGCATGLRARVPRWTGHSADERARVPGGARAASCARPDSGRIATVIGRFYAMDRDKRWDRVKQAYDAMVRGRRSPRPGSAGGGARLLRREGDGRVRPARR